MNVAKVLTLFLSFLLASAGRAVSHEDAVLTSPQSSVVAGEVLELHGSDFSKKQTYLLRLVGALREYELRQVQSDSAGRFSLELIIPLGVTSGAYRVTAIAADGDAVATLDLTVLGARRSVDENEHKLATESWASYRHDVGDGGVRADDIRIERNRSAAEWGVIGLLVGLAGGLGLGLLPLGSRDV
ncbi:MAG: hypothetical protein ACE5JR_12070 [Gemmatimonadota bacterium]